MRIIRSVINIILGSLVAAFSLSSCERHTIYATDYGAPYFDTTVRCMYGVDPGINDGDLDKNP